MRMSMSPLDRCYTIMRNDGKSITITRSELEELARQINALFEREEKVKQACENLDKERVVTPDKLRRITI